MRKFFRQGLSSMTGKLADISSCIFIHKVQIGFIWCPDELHGRNTMRKLSTKQCAQGKQLLDLLPSNWATDYLYKIWLTQRTWFSSEFYFFSCRLSYVFANGRSQGNFYDIYSLQLKQFKPTIIQVHNIAWEPAMQDLKMKRLGVVTPQAKLLPKLFRL